MCCWESHTIHLRALDPTSGYLLSQHGRRRKLAAVSGIDGSVNLSSSPAMARPVYALRDATPTVQSQRCHCRPAADGMATWQTIDGGFIRIGHESHASSGSIRITARCSPPTTQPRERHAAIECRDALSGALAMAARNWRYLASATTPDGVKSTVLVQPPQPNHTWGVCVANSRAQRLFADCGDDSGQAWQNMPAARYRRHGGGVSSLRRVYQRWRDPGAQRGDGQQRRADLQRIPVARWRDPLAESRPNAGVFAVLCARDWWRWDALVSPG